MPDRAGKGVTGLELNIILLCFSAALCTCALITRAKPDWDPERLLASRKVFALSAAAVFLLAVVVRLWKFGAVPSGMNQDGAMAAVDALALAEHGTDRFGTRLPVYFEAWGYGQMSVLLSYLMVPFIKLFGLNAVTARLPMLLVSLAGLWVLFRFMERTYGRAAALLVLLFTAIDPWHIMQSRWALDCNLLPHFLLFSLYFLHRGLEKRAYLYLSMVFFGLTMYTYGIAFFTIPLLLILLCTWLLVKKRIKPAEAGRSAAVYLAIAWPIFAVVIINTFKLKTWATGLITMQYFPDSIRTNDLILYSKDFFGQLIRNFQSMADMAILQTGDFSWNYVREYGQVYLFTLPFILLGLWYLVGGRREAAKSDQDLIFLPDDTGRYMLICWLIVAVVTGLMINGVNTNRINIIFYPLCILAGLGIRYALCEAAPVRRVAAAMAVVFALSFAGFTTAYFGDHAREMANDFCSGLPEAVRHADGLDSDVVYVTCWSRDEQAYTCSEIYTLFGASVDAEYFQGKADAYSSNEKKLLPYAQRYRYVDFDNFTFDQPAGSVYVFNAKEGYYFDQSEYDTAFYGGFGVAVKLHDWVELAPDETPDDEEPVG